MILLMLLVIGDNVSTYLCLTTSSDVYHTWEANPISAWMFQAFGMIPAMLLQTVIKLAALVWVYSLIGDSRSNLRVTWVTVMLLIVVTGYVNLNNWYAYSLM